VSAPTIDPVTFRQLQEAAGAEFVADLVGTFLEEAPRMFDDMREALVANEAERFRRAAHSLKSNSNTFGALKLGAMAREVELGGLERALQAASDPLGPLEEEYARVATALKDLRDA
jgi:HPt (histidine-containing phosphotransfer) domain-containing protein